ncbi:MAG TPA: hypothetical protein PLE74_00930 [Candidatus Cloacimonadota bacterium]|nr:hypothetical protein [Candidatus Cloacimonadota bacterium]
MEIKILKIDGFTCLNYLSSMETIQDRYLIQAVMSYVIQHKETKVIDHAYWKAEYHLIIENAFEIFFIKEQTKKTEIYLKLIPLEENLFLNYEYQNKILLLGIVN